MQKLVWKNSIGDEINLTSGSYGITEWEGFANTSLNIQSQQVPFQDGGVFLDALMEQRELSVTLAMNDGGNLENRYRLRRELIHILNPKLGEGYLVYTNDFISKRIKCVAQIPLFETHNSNDSGTPKASLAWTACEPYWEDLEETIVPIMQGEVKRIFNEGETPINISAEIFNRDVSNLKLSNVTNEKYIRLEVSNNNSIFSINTNMGNKSIMEYQLEINLIYKSLGFIYKCLYFDKLNEIVVVTGGLFYTTDTINYENKATGINGNVIDLIYIEDLDKYIAVGRDTNDNAGVWISDNGYDFTPIILEGLGYNAQLNSVTYSDSLQLIIAVGNNGVIFTSSDGNTWNFINTQSRTFLLSVDCSDSLIMAVGQRGNILTSTDSINWNDKSASFSNDLTSVKNKDNYFYIGTSGGGLIKTQDGSDLESLHNTGVIDYVRNIDFQNGIYTISYGFAALGRHGGIVYTRDFEVFHKVIDVSDAPYFSCCYVPTLGVYVGFGFSRIEFTEEGIISNEIFLQSFSTQARIEYDDKLGYIIPANAGRICFVKENIGTFIQFPTEVSFGCVATSKNQIIVLCGNASAIYNKNTENWSFNSINISANTVIYSEVIKKFIATTSSNMLYSSDDGVNWNLLLNSGAFKITEDKNYLYIISNDGKIEKTNDGVNWEEIISLNLYVRDFVYIKYLKSFLLITNENGKSIVRISSDKCQHFTQIILPTNNAVIGCCFSDSMIILFGYSGFTYCSYDGYNYYLLADDVRSKCGGYSQQEGFLLCESSYYKINHSNIENAINKISDNSNMNFNLSIGKNDILLNAESGILNAILKYRQKYIGV